MKSPEYLGRLAYEEYGDAVEWKNFADGGMPEWDELPQKIRDAWIRAALAVQVSM